MNCSICGKPRGFTGCGTVCETCLGGTLTPVEYRGFRPFMHAVGSGLDITEARRDDIRRRKIDKTSGDGVNHVYRDRGRKVFVGGPA